MTHEACATSLVEAPPTGRLYYNGVCVFSSWRELGHRRTFLSLAHATAICLCEVL